MFLIYSSGLSPRPAESGASAKPAVKEEAWPVG